MILQRLVFLFREGEDEKISFPFREDEDEFGLDEDPDRLTVLAAMQVSQESRTPFMSVFVRLVHHHPFYYICSLCLPLHFCSEISFLRILRSLFCDFPPTT